MEEEEDRHMEPGIRQGQGKWQTSYEFLHVPCATERLCLHTCVGEKCQDPQREGVSTEESFSRVPEQKEHEIELFFISQN